MPYKLETRLDARRLWIEEGIGATEISRQMGGKPTAQTVLNWSNETDKDGLTWEDHRETHVEMMISASSPQQMATRLMARMEKLLAGDISNPKAADDLAKYASVFRKLTDPAYQISMTYQVLTDWITFCKDEYPDLITEDMIAATRDFKASARRRLGL